jgi:hypothetical protein
VPNGISGLLGGLRVLGFAVFDFASICIFPVDVFEVVGFFAVVDFALGAGFFAVTLVIFVLVVGFAFAVVFFAEAAFFATGFFVAVFFATGFFVVFAMFISPLFFCFR